MLKFLSLTARNLGKLSKKSYVYLSFFFFSLCALSKIKPRHICYCWVLGGRCSRCWFFCNSSPEVCKIVYSEMQRGSENNQRTTKVIRGGNTILKNWFSDMFGFYVWRMREVLGLLSPAFSWKHHWGLLEDKLGSGSMWLWRKNNKTLGTVGSEEKEAILFYFNLWKRRFPLLLGWGRNTWFYGLLMWKLLPFGLELGYYIKESLGAIIKQAKHF